MSTTIAISPDLYKVISAFEGFEVILDKYLTLAGQEAGQVLIANAISNMNFKNPTGNLADSIHVVMTNPKYFQIGTDSPYGNRREWGFSGKTDSRGRYFKNDPGKYFMSKSITASKPGIQEIYLGALTLTLAELVGGLEAVAGIVQDLGAV